MVSYISKFYGWFKTKFWNKELEISVVGLQNSGKTTLLSTLATGAFDDDTIPTIGFNLKEIKKGKVSIKVWDLGGQIRFRESWEKYCRNSDAIVFVVDAADISQIDQAMKELHELVQYPSLLGIPLLLLGNKNDLDGSLTEEELIQEMNLRTITNREVACFSISAKNVVNIDITIKYLSSLKRRTKNNSTNE